MTGRVVSTKLTKTVTILVERVARHPLYKKTFVRSKKYLVHDPLGVKEGDVVEVIKVRPISKNKHWQITRVIGKSLVEIAEEKLKQAAKETIAEVMPEEKESEQVTVDSGQKEDKQSLRSNDLRKEKLKRKAKKEAK